MCKTPLDNQIELLTMSLPSNDSSIERSKKVIFIMARTHPMETAGSLVLEGILEQLLNLVKRKN